MHLSNLKKTRKRRRKGGIKKTKITQNEGLRIGAKSLTRIYSLKKVVYRSSKMELSCSP